MMSVWLAKAFSIYFLVIGVAMIFNRQAFMARLNATMQEEGALLISAIMTLILGIILVLSNNIWAWGWPVVVTILCWLVEFRLFYQARWQLPWGINLFLSSVVSPYFCQLCFLLRQ